MTYGAAAGELAAALRADLAARLRACPASVAIDGGWVVRNDRLAAVHQLNAIVLGTAAPLDPRDNATDAGGIEALARLWQADRAEHCVVIDDDRAGERLSGELADRGWERVSTLVMALGTDPPAAVRDPRARRLDESALRALERACLSELGASANDRLPELLADAQALLRAATPSVVFGAGPPGDRPTSMCTLLLHDDVGGRRVATIEAVATLGEHRQQGLARATISAAIRAAGDWRADLIAVLVDADDWPQLMYASLGFRPLGRRRQFVRPGDHIGGVASRT